MTRKAIYRYIIILFILLVCVCLFSSGCGDKEVISDVSSDLSSVASSKVSLSEQSEQPTVQVNTDVTVFAGSAAPGFTDGENEAACFIKPYGLCAAPGGGLLIVDSYANLLRVSKDRLTSRLAGNTSVLDSNGLPIGSYLNGENDKAYLNRPRFAASTSQGAVVFSDTGNNCIRISVDGVVRLLAGDGTRGYKNGTYQTARFDTPSGVAVSADGIVYVADTLNHCIRAISPKGEVSTIAGIPQKAGFKDGSLSEALFCEPNDIQLGSDGALYVVDKGNQRIRRIANQTVTTVAGSGGTADSTTGYIVGGYADGASAQAQFQYPTGLFVTANGTIYVADTGNNCIRVILPDGTVSTVAGTRMAGNVSGSVKEARFNQPIDVYCENQTLYVSDSYNHVIRAIRLAS